MLRPNEHNRWAFITLAACITVIIAAGIVSNSGRYVPVSAEGGTVTILDTKTGDILTPTNSFAPTPKPNGVNKRIWIRKKLSDAEFSDNR